ncbi:sialate O-acetylesterase [Duganella lactea]|nr:sialate O-acetylesterase [Duganella lactea]
MQQASLATLSLVLICALGATAPAQAQDDKMTPIPAPAQPGAIPLNTGPLPGAATQESWHRQYRSVFTRNVTQATLTPFLPAPGKASGAAVIVAPGGAFRTLSMENEGWQVAQALADRGVAAFVLKYRLIQTPADIPGFERSMAELFSAAAKRPPATQDATTYAPQIADARAAFALVRARAAGWHIDPDRVGMVGFSAGAMLTMATTLHGQDAKPAFIGNIYGPLGAVTAPADAPPLFIGLAADDPLFGNTGYGLVDSWRQVQRPVEFHLFERGGHGFGMYQKNTTSTGWFDSFVRWLGMHGYLRPAESKPTSQPASGLGLARVFSDHAVLQRDQPLTVWGTARAGQRVVLTLGPRSVNGNADAQGRWRLQLPAQPAGGPYTLTVRADGQTLSRDDVLVGDVYLCSGQSNMEYAVSAATNAFGAVQGAHNDKLRYLNVPKHSAAVPQAELPAASAWTRVTPETVGAASAACYYMARSLQAKYQVPVGFINASWGGTTIQGWIAGESLGTLDDYRAGVAAVAQYGADRDAGRRAEAERNAAWWRANDPAAAAQQAWTKPDFDDAAWPQLTPPGSWKDSGLAGFKDFDGVTWYRTSVTLTAEQARAANALRLGPIDTYDSTWVNGEPVGGTSTAWVWRDYAVPTGVFRAGRNVIAVRVLNSGKNGGLAGRPSIGTADGQSIPLTEAWKVQRGSALKGLKVPPAPWDVPTSLTTLYNGMIAPLAGYGFKLAAWYQGESNAGAAQEYRTLLPLLMRDWRQRLGQPALPFLVVQLPGYGATARTPGQSGWAELRDAQAAAVAGDANAGLAVTLDIGDRFDIHPTQKTVVGERLARAARSVAYGDKTASGSPAALSAQRRGGDIVIAFRDNGGGLVTYSSDRAIGFEVCAGAACRYAEARVAGDTVVLPGAAGADVTRVRYAWADAPFVNLFSGDDLPAAPFQLELR